MLTTRRLWTHGPRPPGAQRLMMLTCDTTLLTRQSAHQRIVQADHRPWDPLPHFAFERALLCHKPHGELKALGVSHVSLRGPAMSLPLPVQGTRVQILGPGRSHTARGKPAMGHTDGAHTLLLKPARLKSVLCSERSHGNEQPCLARTGAAAAKTEYKQTKLNIKKSLACGIQCFAHVTLQFIWINI